MWPQWFGTIWMLPFHGSVYLSIEIITRYYSTLLLFVLFVSAESYSTLTSGIKKQQQQQSQLLASR